MTLQELRDDLRDAISNLRASRDKYRARPDWATSASRERAVVLRGVIVELWPRRHDDEKEATVAHDSPAVVPGAFTRRGDCERDGHPC